MARCSSCATMVSLETGEPEISGEELQDGQVSFEVRVTRNCANCSDELKETTFSFEQSYSTELEAHIREHHPDLVVTSQDQDGMKLVDISDFELEMGDATADESGGGRYQKNMISCEVTFFIMCTLCPDTCSVCTGEERDHDNRTHTFQRRRPEPVVTGVMNDQCAAGQFDEL